MDDSTLFAFLGAYFFFILAIVIFMIVCKWKIYQKAGKPGWASIVPIYGTLVFLEIIRKPWWWFFLLIIPGVNFIFGIWATNLLSKSFGKNEGFTIGLLFLSIVFYPIMAFDKSIQYIYNTTNEVDQIGQEN